MLIDAYFELQYKAFEFQQEWNKDCCDELLRQLGLTLTLSHGVHHSLSNHSVRSQILKLFVFLLVDKKKCTLVLGIGFGLGMK